MSLKLKTYFSASVEAAFVSARHELGDEAMLVESRRTAPEFRHLGEYEVVFALSDPAAASEVTHATEAPAGGAAPPPFRLDRLAEEVAGIRQELARIKDSLNRPSAFLSGEALADPGLCSILSVLQQQDVAPLVTRQVAAALRSWAESAGDAGAGALRMRRAASEHLERLVKVAPSVGRSEGQRRIAAFVGPPGAGKTASLVKLAATEAVRCRRPAILLSFDTERIAGPEQLRCYAAVLGVAFQAVERGARLEQVLAEHRNKGLILIDTPGFSPGDMDYAQDLSAALAKNPEVDTHLVLSAAMKATDVSSAVERYSVFQPAKLLFTRLDETTTYGPIVNEAVRTGWPVSYLCGGQQIPEDIEPAASGRIAELVLPGLAALAGAG